MSKRKKKCFKKSVFFFMSFILLLFFSLVLVLSGKVKFDKISDKSSAEETKKIQIIDEESKSRPIAVMINNHPSARLYHSGLQDAYLTYEIIVEGGYTRYMSLYKDKNTDRIGSVRSSRHYFLDYALENDAIYIHWGYSPQALEDMSSYKIEHIDGISYENRYFFRDKSLNVSLEHTGFTSMELIKKGINNLGFRTETKKDILFNYSADSVNLRDMNNTLEALEVVIPYSGVVTTSYKYDADNKVYLMYVNGKEHTDYVTKKQYSVKNIITYQVSNGTLTNDVKGRQDIDNIGSGTGYYITEGYAVPIKWQKKYKSSQTIYMYDDGTEINVNDGNTWIHIQPSSRKLTINGREGS